jgi:hypothetical protein
MPENTGFVAAAFIVTWIAVIGYQIRLVRVTRRAREQMRDAERRTS